MKPKTIISVVIFFLFFKMTFAQEVISTNPTQNAINVDRSTTIKVKFDSLMDGNSLSDNTFVVNGLRMGLIDGSLNYTDTDTSVTFTPLKDFCAGEIVTVVLTKDIETVNSTYLDTAFAFSFTTTTTNGSATFFTKTDYETGNSPHTIISADYDGNRTLDLAVTNYNSNTVSIFLNNGDGTFSTKADYVTGNGPRSVFSADFDRDSDLDLVVTNYYFGNSVSILLNNGDGSFGTKVDYVTGSDHSSGFSTDFYGDSDLDLAVFNEVSNTVSILFNNGDGTFTA